MEEQLTKKERKALKKQEQEEHRKREAEAKRAQKTRTWTIVIISTIVIVGFLAWIINNAPAQESAFDSTPDTINPVDASDHAEGASAENAKVTVIEYSDFECPACGQYYPILKTLVGTYGNDMRFIYRYLPLAQLHPNALLSAHYAEAAGMQGKFFEMHDLLFENQSSWAGAPKKTAEDMFKGFGESLGLDVNQLEADANSDAVAEKVNANRIDAIGAGAKGTPTFFVDGELLTQNPQSYQEFEDLILSKTGGEKMSPDTGTQAAPTLEGAELGQ